MSIIKRLKTFKNDKARLSILEYRQLLLKDEDGVQGIAYDSERVQTTPTLDGIANIACKNVEEELKIAKEMKRLRLGIDELTRALEGLTDTDGIILTLHYTDGLKWDLVSCRVGYSNSCCRARAKEAVKELEKLLA